MLQGWAGNKTNSFRTAADSQQSSQRQFQVPCRPTFEARRKRILFKEFAGYSKLHRQASSTGSQNTKKDEVRKGFNACISCVLFETSTTQAI
jgi:hypothetical protein